MNFTFPLILTRVILGYGRQSEKTDFLAKFSTTIIVHLSCNTISTPQLL